MTGQAPREMHWNVHGLELAGLAWGEPTGLPVLCLHGWLDNAASFAVLGPLLEGCFVVAPDLTGHGRSQWRSPDATYQIWDDLPELVGILESLGWSTFNLLGHSRGAIIASLLAASMPERVNSVVMLDTVAPEPVPSEQFPDQMRRFLQDKKRLQASATRSFSGLDQAVAARQDRGLSAEIAGLLVERSLKLSEGRLTWTTDPRLHGASAVKLDSAQVDEVLGRLSMPTLLLLARHGHGGRHVELEATARRSIPEVEIDYVDGSHHFHMEPDMETIVSRVREVMASS